MKECDLSFAPFKPSHEKPYRKIIFTEMNTWPATEQRTSRKVQVYAGYLYSSWSQYDQYTVPYAYN